MLDGVFEYCIYVNVRTLGVVRVFFFFSSRRRHTRYIGDWSSDVCSSDLSGCAGATSGRTYPAAPSSGSPSSDRKSTRLNSSHRCISYAVFCLKKKKKKKKHENKIKQK